ncbi:MAG: hypothetical protein JWR80_6682 [Bradyrhizobium sp.]|jgi:hypothetical protein|nr:hypothetical protein [Bradyrhizobium sp.]
MDVNDEVVLEPRGQEGRPQVRRERADRLVSALAMEAERINNDPLPWYNVTRLSVFGSYLSSKPVLGDLDIAIRTTPRWRSDGGFTRAWQDFPSVCKPPAWIARDTLNLIHWPRLYILMRLKRLGKGISMHAQEDLDSCGFEHRIIFETAESAIRYPR